MDAERALLPFERKFSASDFAVIKCGLVPQVMEDKWFIFVEGEWLYLHRSWTGVCVFQVKLEKKDDEFVVTEAWVNRNQQQYRSTDESYDTKLLAFLIDRLLLSRDVPFPDPPGINT